MNEKSTRNLIVDFPHLYRNMRAGEGAMQFGFECDSGWFDIVYKLSAQIEGRALQAGLVAGSEHWPSVRQVKEKFGELRFSVQANSEVIYTDLVAAANIASDTTCEFCGRAGQLRTSGWHQVRCGSCETSLDAIRVAREAEWDDQRLRGGYRAVIDKAFVEVDAKKEGCDHESV